MWFWNRIEVYCGYSLTEFSELRDILASKGLNYSYRLVNRSSSASFASNRARSGTFGQNPALDTQYYLYVHKKDYENAMFYLRSSRQDR